MTPSSSPPADGSRAPRGPGGAATTHALLDVAVARGIVTAGQRAAILALADAPDAHAPDVDAAAVASAATRPGAGIRLAYGAGAAAVLFAMGWFLADRWGALGAWGVLGVVAGYAALFLLAARLLRREGFATAGALALLLAVTMVPLATWAVLRLAGFWPPRGIACTDGALAWCHQGWIVAELVTILAALLAYRATRIGLLTTPIGIALLLLLRHVVESLRAAPLDALAGAWSVVLGASLLAALAYAVDRRATPAHAGAGTASPAADVDAAGDAAGPLWAAAVAAATLGTLALWNGDTALRPLLGPIGLVAAVAALSLRRRVVLAWGVGAMLAWLGWLAFDVFERVLAFPLALAATGLAIILATVLVQRHFPSLVHRLRIADPAGRRVMPGGTGALLAPALLALAMLPDATRRDRDQAATGEVQALVWRRRMHREAVAAHRRGDPPAPKSVVRIPADARPPR